MQLFFSNRNSYNNHLLVVVHTEKDDKIRIISARKATKNENKQYEENSKKPRYA
ncbi:MAG: BrnT family toxin [Actinobacteria bacterium]|nr:BrnT family toxin [Actinomycetota bacterium]